MKFDIKKKPSGLMSVTAVMAVILTIISILCVWLQINNIEDGILEVYAAQQDAYVQLVFDQINIKQNRDDEEIVNDILSSLDASSNKYWTFSKEHSLLFVKDIIETNRYKELTTASYYATESAEKFFNNLSTFEVTHSNVEIDDKYYLASGIIFNYGGNEYKLCLLTNKSVILNNNKFMSAKLEIIILEIILLIILIAVSMIFAGRIDKNILEIKAKNKDIDTLHMTVQQLNELLREREHYDTRYQLWGSNLIKDFLIKMKTKGILRVVEARLECNDENSKYVFVDRASVMLDRRVIRFSLGEKSLLLLYIYYDEEHARKSLEPLLNGNEQVKLSNITMLDLNNINIDEYDIYSDKNED